MTVGEKAGARRQHVKQMKVIYMDKPLGLAHVVDVGSATGDMQCCAVMGKVAGND